MNRLPRTKANGLAVAIALVALFWGCADAPVPKPIGYYRIDFPEKHYRLFDTTYPFRFMYPEYGIIHRIPDNDSLHRSIWLNVDFPRYRAHIHLSYMDVAGNLELMTEDARKLAYKHTYKAEAINERVFTNEKERVYGILYDIQGNSASSIQFYVTDSSRHYIRGALYFRCRPNKDSLAPAVRFFVEDVIKLIETLRWK